MLYICQELEVSGIIWQNAIAINTPPENVLAKLKAF